MSLCGNPFSLRKTADFFTVLSYPETWILLAAEILKGAVPCHPLRIKASDHMAFKGHLTIKG